MKFFTPQQRQTIDSFTEVNDDFCLLVCHHDYDLPAMLQGEPKNTLALLFRSQKELKKQHACSAFQAFDPEGKPLLGRNFDYKKDPVLAVWTCPKVGYQSLSLTSSLFVLCEGKIKLPLRESKARRLLSAPYMPMDGINEKGLAIAVLEIKDRVKRPKDKHTIPPSLAVRAVLDTCAGIAEAVAFFQSHLVYDSTNVNYHFLIVDQSGNSAIVEYVDSVCEVIYGKEKERQCLTNFYLSEKGNNDKGFGFSRFDYLKSVLDMRPSLGVDEALGILSQCHLNYRSPWGYSIVSQYSAVYENESQMVTLCANLDYAKEYRLRLNQPGAYEQKIPDSFSLPPFAFAHDKS